jgi:uncharacterized protein YkwD
MTIADHGGTRAAMTIGNGTMNRTTFVLLIAVMMSVLGRSAVAQQDAQVLLDAHNADRAKHCVPPLTWSPVLAAGAQQWANRCVFAHSHASGLGENLAWGTNLSAGEAVDLWYDEIDAYNYSVPGFSAETGHFTQVIWRDSTQLGCGRAVCGREIFWVCRYAPPGNYLGRFPANVPPVCR